MLSETLRFIKGDEYREVWIMDNGQYRIKGMNGCAIGKLHNNATEYISNLLQNGWHKCNLAEYLRTKYRI